MSHPNLNTFSPSSFSQAPSRTIIPKYTKGSDVLVIGGGAFGSWTALYLLRGGFRVTLLDRWGPGNSRSSSGDETRVIRSTYGSNETYFDLNVQALNLWKENEQRFAKKIFFNTGVLWFCYNPITPIVDDSIPFAKKHAMEYEYLLPHEIKKRYPEIKVKDLHHAYFDPHGGYLKARESVQAVHEAFVTEGGRYIQSDVQPGTIISNRLSNVVLSDGTKLQADAYIFACGSWLGKLFPNALGQLITSTKQEVYYFGVPAEASQEFENLPVWVDVDGKNFYYGIPGNAHRGFKIGVDVRGVAFDPSSDDRILSPETLRKAREFIEHRFPLLKGAPLLESRVCPYENSPDGNFIFDFLPDTTNAFVLGGGSGHGFKHSPALGQLVAQTLSGYKDRPPLFSLPSN